MIKTKASLLLSYHKEQDNQVWVTIYDSRCETSYDISRVPSDWGTCYEWSKFLMDRKHNRDSEYHVLLTGDHREDRCTCPGFHYRGTCRHMQATLEMQERGLLP
jgi:SWIM zinc finger